MIWRGLARSPLLDLVDATCGHQGNRHRNSQPRKHLRNAMEFFGRGERHALACREMHLKIGTSRCLRAFQNQCKLSYEFFANSGSQPIQIHLFPCHGGEVCRSRHPQQRPVRLAALEANQRLPVLFWHFSRDLGTRFCRAFSRSSNPTGSAVIPSKCRMTPLHCSGVWASEERLLSQQLILRFCAGYRANEIIQA
jgi:hypothetical protein